MSSHLNYVADSDEDSKFIILPEGEKMLVITVCNSIGINSVRKVFGIPLGREWDGWGDKYIDKVEQIPSVPSLSPEELIELVDSKKRIQRWRQSENGVIIDYGHLLCVNKFANTGKVNHFNPLYLIEGNGTNKPTFLKYYASDSEFKDFPQDVFEDKNEA